MYFFEIRQLEEIAKDYFEILEDYFKGIYEPGVNKFFQADRFNFYETAAQTILFSIEDLEDELNSFWVKNKDKVIQLTSNSEMFKVLYCGSPSPLNGMNFIKKTALYLDSLLIEDPVSFLLKTQELSNDKAYLHQLIKHVFNLLDMKQLFFGEGSIPVLIIFPSIIDENQRKNVVKIIEKSGEDYFKLLFNKDFADTGDVFDYLSCIDSVENLINKSTNMQYLFPDTNNKQNRVEEMFLDIKESWKYNDKMTVGSALGYKIYGQFFNLGNQVYQAHCLSAQIAFDRKEYWNLYKWDINHSKGITPDLDSTILHSLQLDEFKWLENIEMDKFNLVRNEKELQNIRSIIRSNIHTSLNGINEDVVRKQALLNLEEALIEHSKKMDSYSKEIKKKFSIDTLAVVGGVISSIPASLAMVPIIGVTSTVYGIYDLVANTNKTIKDKKKLNNSITGVLFDAKQKSI